jgi:hypothetical protein
MIENNVYHALDNVFFVDWKIAWRCDATFPPPIKFFPRQLNFSHSAFRISRQRLEELNKVDISIPVLTNDELKTRSAQLGRCYRLLKNQR